MTNNGEIVHRRNSLFGPIVLIGVGVLLLLSNFGLLNLDIWQLLSRFWPVILIAVGLDLLLGRRSGVGAMIAVVLLILVVVGSLPWFNNVVAGPVETRTISQELQGARQGEVTIAASVGELRLTALPSGDQLIEGTVVPVRNTRVVESFRLNGQTAIYALQSEGSGVSLPFWNWGRQGRWDLRLTDRIPVALVVSTGVGRAEVDLTRLQVQSLQINSGVGQTEVTLPAQGEFRGEISGGVGEVIVLVPDTLAVRIEADTGLGGVNVTGDFTRSGDTYTSPNYAEADERVELSVSGGVGAVTIRQVEKR
jgi:hypothetical protein